MMTPRDLLSCEQTRQQIKSPQKKQANNVCARLFVLSITKFCSASAGLDSQQQERARVRPSVYLNNQSISASSISRSSNSRQTLRRKRRSQRHRFKERTGATTPASKRSSASAVSSALFSPQSVGSTQAADLSLSSSSQQANKRAQVSKQTSQQRNKRASKQVKRASSSHFLFTCERAQTTATPPTHSTQQQ